MLGILEATSPPTSLPQFVSPDHHPGCLGAVVEGTGRAEPPNYHHAFEKQAL